MVKLLFRIFAQTADEDDSDFESANSDDEEIIDSGKESGMKA